MSVESKVPEIRFEGFSGAWKEKKLDTITDVLDGDRGNSYPNGNDLQERGHTLFLSASNVTTQGFKFDNNQYITEKKSNSMGNGKLISGDIVLTSRGSIGHIAWYNEDIKHQVPFARVNSGMLILRSKDIVDPCIVTQFLKSPLGQKKIDLISFGSAQPQLTKQSVENYAVTIPCDLKEQTKIGSYFQQLDTLIAQHQDKHDKLLQIKKSLLEKMFPQQGEAKPEIRFKGFSEPWEEQALGEIVDVRSGRDYKHLSRGYIPVYGTGGYMLSVNKALSYDEDAIGIGRKGTIDKPYVLKAPFWTVDTLFYAVPNGKNYLDFVFSIFQKINWKQKDESTGVPSLSKVAISSIMTYTTNPSEQTKIGNLFKNLDTLLSQHQSQLKKLKQIKQACLAKMFV